MIFHLLYPFKKVEVFWIFLIVFYHICDEVVIMDLILFWSKYGRDEGRLEECTTEKVGGPTFSVVALTGDYINKKRRFFSCEHERTVFFYLCTLFHYRISC